MKIEHDLEDMARMLEESRHYRVLRKLELPQSFPPYDRKGTRCAIVFDCETTGLRQTPINPSMPADQIISVAMIPFIYRPEDGIILDIGQSFDRLRQPSVPISPEITAMTGLDDATVEGHVIDEQEIIAFLERASGCPFGGLGKRGASPLIIAWNARFDRNFAEAHWEIFRSLPWACAKDQIDWRSAGHEGTKLASVVTSHGLFYEAHRAVADCAAVVELLRQTLPNTDTTAFMQLLERARRATCRVWAVGSPFAAKDLLKERTYRWNDGGNGRPRSWYRDVEETEMAAELAFLEEDALCRGTSPTVTRITAFDRFSDRC